MKIFTRLALTAVLVAEAGVTSLAGQDTPSAKKGGVRKGGGGITQTVWSPKSVKLLGWQAPHKPVTKLADILKAHQGKASWTVPVVRDEHLYADYVQMAAGEKTRRRMHPETRAWWVIQDGQIRFTIDGVGPFVASKGYLVQVPYRTFYRMETGGDKPSLRFEVNIAGAKTQYPADEAPPVLKGFDFVKTTVTGRGTYNQGNRPFIDFNNVVAGPETQRRFIADDCAVSNIIFGNAKDLPPAKDTDKGHFHPECAESWFILLGKMEYKMEGAGIIYADQGDIVYAPRMYWHRPRFSGEGPACRLAMNGYQDIAHMFEAH